MIRLRNILTSRWVLAFSVTAAVYVLAGFLLLPLLIQQYAPAMASAQLRRPVTVGAVRFNPLRLTLELENLSVTEPQGEPLITLGRLFADLEIRGVVRRAVTFREVRLDKPFVRTVLGEDGRFNLAKLADTFSATEDAHDDTALPRLVIDDLSVADGVVELADQSRHPPVSERLEAINLQIEAISTLPDHQASHHVTATFNDGSLVDWHGQLSLDPLASDGEMRLHGLKLSTPWRFVKDRLALQQPEGRLDLATAYGFRQNGDRYEFTLSELAATIGGLKLVPVGEKDPVVALEKVQLNRASVGLNDHSVRIPEFTFYRGKLKATIDNQGIWDWQQLVKSTFPKANVGAAAPHSETTTVEPWHITVDALKLSDVSLQLTDVSRRLPIDFRISIASSSLKGAMDTGMEQSRLSIHQFGSELRGLVLAPVGGKEPLLAIETLLLADGAFDLTNRTLKLPSISMSRGLVRIELDAAGALNWQKVAAIASASVPGEPVPHAETMAHTAPPPARTESSNSWHIDVDQAKVEQIGLRYADDSRKSPIQLEVASVNLGLRAAVEAGATEPAISVDKLQSEIKHVVLRERHRERPLATLESLNLSGGQIDLAKNTMEIQQIRLNGGSAKIERTEQGAIRLGEIFASRHTNEVIRWVDEAKIAAKAEGKPWRLKVDQTLLNGFDIAFADLSTTPPSNIGLSGADFRLNNFSNDGKTPLTFDGKLNVEQGGTLSLEGKALSTGERAAAHVRIDRLNLRGLQPYVAQVAALKLDSGTLSTDIQLDFQRRQGRSSLSARGEMATMDLTLKESKSGKRFASWGKLTAEGIDFSQLPDKLTIKEIRAIKPEANIEIFEDRTTNLDAIFATAQAGAKAKPSARLGKREADPPFAFSVQRVKVDEGIIDFSDVSLVLPFKTRIQNLGGTISGISNAPTARTLLKLDGRVDEYGEANLEGTLNALQHNAYSDMKLIFRNVDMASLSPYSGTFAGRRIQSGKLNSTLKYKIVNGKLESFGEIELDQLSLGAQVESKKAASLPLDLAVALLTDSSGKINLSIPIEGDVHSPEFSYGGVIWSAITTTITKAVTAPFTALAGAFDNGEPDIGEIFFIPGKNGLPPAAIEKLKKLAQGMTTRPHVILAVQGTFDPRVDAEALKSWDVRTEATERLGITVLPGEDPGPLAFDNAKTQKSLEEMAAERGNRALASAQSTFRDKYQREPQRIRGLSAWLGKASEDASFYRMLFDQLVASAPLPPNALPALAERRAVAIVKELGVYKGVDQSRLRRQKVAAAKEKEGRVPSKLDLTVGKQNL